MFVVDGPRALSTAVDTGVRLNEFYIDSPERLTDTVVATLERAAAGRDIDVFLLEPSVFSSVADSAAPQGVMAVGEMNPAALDDVTNAARVVVLDGVQDPGNVGAVIRAAAAFEFDAVVACTGCGDPWSPKAVRGAAGTIGLLDVVVGLPVDTTLSRLGTFGISRVATDMSGSLGLDAIAEIDQLAIVLGSEGNGLSATAWPHIDASVAIEMAGAVESLNVAVTAGIVLHAVSLR